MASAGQIIERGDFPMTFVWRIHHGYRHGRPRLPDRSTLSPSSTPAPCGSFPHPFAPISARTARQSSSGSVAHASTTRARSGSAARHPLLGVFARPYGLLNPSCHLLSVVFGPRPGNLTRITNARPLIERSPGGAEPVDIPRVQGPAREAYRTPQGDWRGVVRGTPSNARDTFVYL